MYQKKQINKNLLKEVSKRFFLKNPVKIKQRFEGQGISGSGNYLLGCYAGPEMDISHLFHEMAHLAEREEKAILEKPFSGWGFSHGKYWEVAGQCGWEPQTEQQVLREGRKKYQVTDKKC